MPTRRQFSPLVAFLLLASVLPARAALEVQPGIGFVAITGAAEGTEIVLEDRRHREVSRGTADRFGSLIFRELKQGGRYFIREASAADGSPVTVLRFKDRPGADLYRGQTLHEGLNYIRTRDGTLLAAMVRRPLFSASFDDGPFPTVVEYSGYSPADPDSPQPSTQIAGALGFATVGVNMRGSGCSGGVFDLFDLPTTADGYDIIETVAAQSWVREGKVGMVGISFPGISQLFVGGARPPHLTAIAPFSVIGDIYRSPGYPGGIFNNGFAESWLADRVRDSLPAPEGGQGWAIKRVNDGDTTCLANQQLRLQTQDAVANSRAHPFYDPAIMDNRSPITWVGKIRVPTFFSAAWQDEQVGGGFADLLPKLPLRRDVKIQVLNGVHSSPIEPAVLWDWFAFLSIYIAEQVPDPTVLAAISPIIYSSILGQGTPLPPLPENRFAGISDLEAARRLFEDDPHVRVLMENGAGSPTPGLPAATFELGFAQWPPKETRPATWYFGEGGTLSPEKPQGREEAADVYHPDPDARPQQTIPGQGQSESWEILPPYDWRPLVDGTAVAYATAPLSEDTTIVGPGSVDLWLRSSATDTDLQVTLTEIRPDGLETYVQNGWLRASRRKLDRKRATIIDPVVTHFERDAKPLASDVFTKVRVELFAVSHTFRAGSRIRVSIEAPGGDRTRWRFETPATNGTVTNEIARDAAHPSRLVLPVIPGVDPPPALPPCPGLRGQPCRTYVPTTTGG